MYKFYKCVQHLPIFVCLWYKFTLQVHYEHRDIVKMLWHMFLLGQTKIK